jgi:hypothetical protein
MLQCLQINTRAYLVNGMGGMAWRAVTCLICTTTVQLAEGLKPRPTQDGHFFAGTTTRKINGTDRNPKGWQSDTIGTSGCKLLLLRTTEQRKWLTNAPKILLR